MKAWPTSGGIMCKTYSGQSVVDYVICSQSIVCNLLEFNIEACPIEMNFDHMPLCIKLGIHTSEIQEGQTQQGHKKVHAIGKILINQENQELFVVALKQHFQWGKNKTENKTMQK